MSSAICWTNHSKAVHCQLSTTHSKLFSQPSAFEEKFWNSEIWVTIFYRKRRDACIGWDRLQKRRRQTGDANVHKFAPQPNWARGPYWCSFARCAESEVEEVEAADATLSNVNSSKSSNWGDFSGVHFGSSIHPAFDRALLFHIWGFLKRPKNTWFL